MAPHFSPKEMDLAHAWSMEGHTPVDNPIEKFTLRQLMRANPIEDFTTRAFTCVNPIEEFTLCAFRLGIRRGKLDPLFFA